jgi:hypothetical protein
MPNSLRDLIELLCRCGFGACFIGFFFARSVAFLILLFDIIEVWDLDDPQNVHELVSKKGEFSPTLCYAVRAVTHRFFARKNVLVEPDFVPKRLNATARRFSDPLRDVSHTAACARGQIMVLTLCM